MHFTFNEFAFHTRILTHENLGQLNYYHSRNIRYVIRNHAVQMLLLVSFHHFPAIPRTRHVVAKNKLNYPGNIDPIFF